VEVVEWRAIYWKEQWHEGPLAFLVAGDSRGNSSRATITANSKDCEQARRPAAAVI
jgi:hypothetical protein